MGYMRHHAIIVTSWDKESILSAHARARELFSQVTEITPPATNAFQSFLVPPDGSKEGWPKSNDGDMARETFIAFLQNEDNGYLQWCEVLYGDEDGFDKLLGSNQISHTERNL